MDTYISHYGYEWIMCTYVHTSHMEKRHNTIVDDPIPILLWLPTINGTLCLNNCHVELTDTRDLIRCMMMDSSASA